jgi:hypothetical protein
MALNGIQMRCRREALGLSVGQLDAAIKANGAQKITQMENGTRPIPPSVEEFLARCEAALAALTTELVAESVDGVVETYDQVSEFHEDYPEYAGLPLSLHHVAAATAVREMANRGKPAAIASANFGPEGHARRARVISDLDAKLWQQFTELSHAQGRSTSDLVQEALAEYLRAAKR